ncbi:MAG TPA: hypothetical protein VMU83_23065 [Hanamia sp.]|nr:hypothetical protein [Hanamia sp.]
MKKIITIILAAAGTIGSASAQSNFQKSIAYNDSKKMTNDYDQHANFGKTNTVIYKDAYFSYKEKVATLAKINREFDQKIVFVKQTRHLNGWQKTNQIQLLQNQRKNEIKKVEFQYAKSNQYAMSKTSGHDSHKW